MLKRIAISFLESPLRNLFLNYEFLKRNIDKEALTDGAISDYSDDSLSGYGDINYTKASEVFLQQPRSFIIPLVEKAIQRTPDKKTIVEIGTGNGDVLGFLSDKYPGNAFIGVDFSVKNAEIKHRGKENLKFIKGYALELLKKGLLKGDIIFASSTFTVFAPKELLAYFKLFNNAGFSQILLQEPTWAGYKQNNDPKVVSKHLDGSCWFHNYCGYLIEAGYKIEDFSFFPHRPKGMDRPDVFLVSTRGIK